MSGALILTIVVTALITKRIVSKKYIAEIEALKGIKPEAKVVAEVPETATAEAYLKYKKKSVEFVDAEV